MAKPQKVHAWRRAPASERIKQQLPKQTLAEETIGQMVKKYQTAKIGKKRVPVRSDVLRVSLVLIEERIPKIKQRILALEETRDHFLLEQRLRLRSLLQDLQFSRIAIRRVLESRGETAEGGKNVRFPIPKAKALKTKKQ